MSPWRRPKKPPDAGPDSTPEEQVDLLYDRASRLLTSEPGTPQSVEAAERTRVRPSPSSSANCSDLAGRAVRQLMQFSDAPDKIQAALAVALTVEATARQAAGDGGRARSAQERAAAIRTLLVRRDRTYADDLGPPSP